MKKTFTLLILFFLISFTNIILVANPSPVNNNDNFETQLKYKIDNMQLDSAIFFLNDALKTNNKNLRNSFEIKILLADKYILKADFSEALKVALKSLDIANKVNDTLLIGRANSYIGTVYYRLRNYDKAETHLNIAIELLKKKKNYILLGRAYYRMATSKDDKEIPKEAYKYYMIALSIFEKENSCLDLAMTYNGLAGYYYKQRMIDKTEYFANKSLEKFLVCGKKNDIAFMYTNIAALYNMENKHSKAIEYNLKAIKIANEINSFSQLCEGYKNLSETYSYIGNFKDAYKYHLKYDIYKDSIFSQKSNDKILELETLYKTAEKEKQILEHKIKQKEQNKKLLKSIKIQNLLYIIIVLCLIIILFIYFGFRTKKRFGIAMRIKRDELKASNDAKNKLFSIISHDLKSPINAFYRLIDGIESNFDDMDKNDIKNYISQMKDSLSISKALLSDLLQWSLKQMGHLTPEIAELNLKQLANKTISFIDAIREEKEIDIQLNIKNDIFIMADEGMINTVLRNIITNAIKFSYPKGKIIIDAKEEGNMVEISIIDKGIGISEKDIEKLFKVGENTHNIGNNNSEKGSGLGLILCKELLDLNNGEIAAKGNEFSGMTFIIKLPIINNNG